MKKSKAAVILAVILAAFVGLAYYASIILSSTGIGEDMSIPLGLDLSGGVSITYQVVDENPSAEDMSDTIYKLQKRVDSYSTEASVYQVGDDRITVEIPGVQDANEILEDLGNPGSLEFQMPDGTVFMTGDMVADAQAATQTDTYGNKEYVVALKLTDEGAKIFGEVTSENIGKNLPIVYDGETISYPRVQTAITGGEAQITGMADFEEAETLATQIRIGSLSLQLSELESSVVGAQLGSQAIASSLKAGAIGLAIVMVFMIVMYAVPGIAASLALAIYTTLVIATLYLFDITLTLPGIAGIILGIGMAVDANVIVFARIREEIATGKSVQTSMKIGFQKAMSAILDGNITTLIASVVLMALGSGTVKGFAYTLMIGIILSLFTAMVVTRYILYSLYALGLKSEKLYGRAKERKSIDFIGKKAVFFTISGIIIAAGLISMGVHSATEGKALNYGLDFMGGTSTTADFGKDMSIEDIENDIVPYVEKVTGDSDVQATKVEGTTQVTIKTRTLSLDERQELEDTLAENCDVDASTITSQSISSTISGEMRSDALKAVIVSCIFMLLYIWFRFKDIRFGASAIIALIHDVLVVLTVYALMRISVGNTFIACMLTIIGYSVNDTIVIYDRIRENQTLLPGIQIRDLVNISDSQSLRRSIRTSVTTFSSMLVVTVVALVMGLDSILSFSIPMMAGIAMGTFNSICFVPSLWVWWQTKRGITVLKPAKKKAKTSV